MISQIRTYVATTVMVTVATHCLPASPARAVNLEWARQFGSSALEYSTSAAADVLGNVYVSGITRGNLEGPSAGGEDGFVAKYDATGNLSWTKQFGTTADDGSQAISADGLGNVYVTGRTEGSLGGPNAGGEDA